MRNAPRKPNPEQMRAPRVDSSVCGARSSAARANLVDFADCDVSQRNNGSQRCDKHARIVTARTARHHCRAAALALVRA